MKTEEQIKLELKEMWDALNAIPPNDPDRDAAFEQGHATEAEAWAR